MVVCLVSLTSTYYEQTGTFGYVQLSTRMAAQPDAARSGHAPAQATEPGRPTSVDTLALRGIGAASTNAVLPDGGAGVVAWDANISAGIAAVHIVFGVQSGDHVRLCSRGT